MLISKFGNGLKKEKIEMFEAEIMIKIPSQLKKFLYKYNGGQTPKTEFKLNKVSSDIKGFYGLGISNSFYDLNQIKNYDYFKGFLVDGYLLVGNNSFGDYILIGVNKENSGKIYYYYHDKPKEYIELSDSFQSFIGKCKSKKIGKIETIEERTQALINDGKSPDYIKPALIKLWQVEIDKYSNMYQEELIIN